MDDEEDVSREIELTVHVWSDDDGIKYNRPTTIKLKADETLFDGLNPLVSCEYRGSLMYERSGDAKVWYNRLVALKPTRRNRWAEFNKHDTEESLLSLELSVRHWSNPRDIPTILIQDIRHIEKKKNTLPIKLDGTLVAMSACLKTI